MFAQLRLKSYLRFVPSIKLPCLWHKWSTWTPRMLKTGVPIIGQREHRPVRTFVYVRSCNRCGRKEMR